MNWVDIILILLLVAAITFGYRKGIIAQLGSIVGVVGGILACRLLGDDVAAHMSDGFDFNGTAAFTPHIFTMIAYIGVFLVAWLAIWGLARLLKLAVHTVLLGPVDGIGGALFMTAKWLLVVSLILNLVKMFFPGSKILSASTMAEGRILSGIIDFAPWIWGLLSYNQ